MDNNLQSQNIFEKYKDILQKSTLFRGLDDEELKGILSCFNPVIRRYKKGEFPAVTGKDFTGIGIVLEGELNISRENQAGHKIMLSKATPSSMFGEMIAFSDHTTWLVTIEAMTDCVILYVKTEIIVSSCSNVCSRHRKVTMNMLQDVTNKALHLKRKIDYLIIKSIRGKVSQLLLEQYEKHNALRFTIKMNRNEMAEFLNVSRPSMSRELANMKDQGIIDYYKNSFVINDLEALMNNLD